MPDVADALDLSDAADALGVHYQTAYRWVRQGRLRAQMVNGRYVVDRADIERLDAERNRPTSPTQPTQHRLDRHAEKMYDALLVGDEATARALARRLVDEGASVIDVIQEVFAPPLRRIGQRWHDGELSIWVEHRASAIVERSLGELTPNPRGRRRGTAMVAAVARDHHSLPTTMAAAALREANWHVHHLGANMPGDELVDFCTEHDVDVAVLSVTSPEAVDEAASVSDRLWAAGIPCLVGRPGASLSELVDDADAARRADARP